MYLRGFSSLRAQHGFAWTLPPPCGLFLVTGRWPSSKLVAASWKTTVDWALPHTRSSSGVAFGGQETFRTLRFSCMQKSILSVRQSNTPGISEVSPIMSPNSSSPTTPVTKGVASPEVSQLPLRLARHDRPFATGLILFLGSVSFLFPLWTGFLVRIVF
jgi:hypothetical protein